jgi:hypothetical protein
MVAPASLLATTVALAFTETSASPPRLVLATPDPELDSALRTAFSPRGMEVVLEAERPLRQATDLPAPEGTADPVVWLCGDADGADWLCVHQGGHTRMIRRVAMARPLSPADAAALALSVDVALRYPEPAAAPTVAAPALAAPAPPRPDAFALTLEVTAGMRSTPIVRGVRYGLDVVYAPWWLDRRVGLGAGLLAGPPGPVDWDHGGGLRPPIGVSASRDDLTFKLFVRTRLPLRTASLYLDAGPALHRVSFDDPVTAVRERTLELSADAALGVVMPLGQFFVGARLGTSYLVTRGSAQLGSDDRRWGTEAVLNGGVGFR